jgi:hypothetical protein
MSALRDVDPTTELIYMGGGEWALMRLRPLNDYRIAVAHRTLGVTLDQCIKGGGMEERQWYARLRGFRMNILGYSHIGTWQFDHEPDWRIVHDFRERAWKLRHDIPYDDTLAEADRRRDAAKARLSSPEAAREVTRALRNPRTVTQ